MVGGGSAGAYRYDSGGWYRHVTIAAVETLTATAFALTRNLLWRVQGPLLPAILGMLSDLDDHVKAAAMDALTALATDATSKGLIAQQVCHTCLVQATSWLSPASRKLT